MVIYKLTSPSNKVYIGKATHLKKRWEEHRRESLRDRFQTHLYRAIRLYGWDNFQKEIIDTAETKEEANQKEIYWISFYHSFEDHEKGYNETAGGDGGKTLSRPWNYGKKTGPLSLDHKKKISGILTERYSKMPHPTKGHAPWNKGKEGPPSPNKGKSQEEIFGERDQESISIKVSKALTGRRLSEETISKIKKARANQIFTEESNQKRIDSLRERAKKGPIHPLLKCPYCGKEGRGESAMYRWHFENCKNK